MKWRLVVLLFFFALPPSGLTVDSQLQSRIAFAESLYSECSPSAYQTLVRDVSYVQYFDSTGRVYFGLTSPLYPTLITTDTNGSSDNFAGSLAHELKHVQQFQSPVNRVLYYLPPFKEAMEHDAIAYSVQVQKDCRVGNLAHD